MGETSHTEDRNLRITACIDAVFRGCSRRRVGRHFLPPAGNTAPMWHSPHTRPPQKKKEMEFYQASRHTTNYQEIRGTGEHVNDTTEVHQPHPGCRRQQRRQSFFDSQRGKRYRGTTNKLKET